MLQKQLVKLLKHNLFRELFDKVAGLRDCFWNVVLGNPYLGVLRLVIRITIAIFEPFSLSWGVFVKLLNALAQLVCLLGFWLVYFDNGVCFKTDLDLLEWIYWILLLIYALALWVFWDRNVGNLVEIIVKSIIYFATSRSPVCRLLIFRCRLLLGFVQFTKHEI